MSIDQVSAMSSSEEVSPLDGFESPRQAAWKRARAEIIEDVCFDDNGRPVISYAGDVPYTFREPPISLGTCTVWARMYLLSLYEKVLMAPEAIVMESAEVLMAQVAVESAEVLMAPVAVESAEVLMAPVAVESADVLMEDAELAMEDAEMDTVEPAGVDLKYLKLQS